MNILIKEVPFVGGQTYPIRQNLPSGGENCTPKPDSPVACRLQEVLEHCCVCVCCGCVVCVCVFRRKPILYALPATTDLKDLAVSIMMMNKSKAFEEESSF